jgi:hypothetical protein
MKDIFCVIGIAATSLVIGCGQGAGDSRSAGESLGTSQAALDTVNDCVTQTQTCAAAAKSLMDGAACEQQLRACLAPLIANAGNVAVPPLVIPDAGFTLPPIVLLDAGFTLPPLVIPDAGFTLPPVVLPDAALPPLPDPAKVQAAVGACVTALDTCLSGSTDPMTCAAQAQTCLRQAI